MITLKKKKMNPRDLQLTELRPKISSAKVSEKMSPEEKFQNKTLRPVIKLQGELIISVFKNYIGKHKNTFYSLNLEKRLFYIENSIQKDIKFRNSLKGIIIGQFTLEEYQDYLQHSSALNKRMMNIVKERLKDSIQLLEKNVVY